MSTSRDAALKYAGNGLEVFPVAGKVPCTPHGLKDASADPEMVRRLFAAKAGDGVAIRTGTEVRGRKLVVVDLDGREGNDWLLELEAANGDLPVTLTAETPNGGWHLYFVVPSEVPVHNSAGKIGRRVDVRGEGGYVVAPPSPGYRWQRNGAGKLSPIAQMPDWLVELVRKPDPLPRPAVEPRVLAEGDGTPYGLAALEQEAAAVRLAPEGQRNDTLNQASFSVGQLEAGGELAPGVAEEALRAAALAAGLSEREVEATLRSGLEAGRAEPRQAPESNGADPRPPRRRVVLGDDPDDDRLVDRPPDRHADLDDDPVPADPGKRLVTVCAADVKPERVTWFWPGWLPAGKLVTLTGDPGHGKSTLALDLAARLTTATRWPDGQSCDHPGDVLILSAEDGTADTIVPRLKAADADLTKVRVVQAAVDENGEIRPVELPSDLHSLEQAMDGVRLVIVDPFNAFLDGQIDSHRDHDVRRALAPQAAVAERTGACVLVIRHWNKSQGKSIYRGSGSIAFIGAARVGLVVAPDPDDEDGARRILAVEKSNLAEIPDSLAYSLLSEPEHGCARIAWHGASIHKADDLASHRAESEHQKLDEAEAFLLNALEDGRRLSTEIKDEAKRAGHTAKTLRRARESLRIVDEREGFPAITYWKLAPSDKDRREESEGPESGDSGDRSSRDHPLGADMGTTVDSVQPSASEGSSVPVVPIKSGHGRDRARLGDVALPPEVDGGLTLARNDSEATEAGPATKPRPGEFVYGKPYVPPTPEQLAHSVKAVERIQSQSGRPKS